MRIIRRNRVRDSGHEVGAIEPSQRYLRISRVCTRHVRHPFGKLLKLATDAELLPGYSRAAPVSAKR